MKYCIDYYKDFKYLNEVEELNIEFNHTDESLLDFLLQHSDKRINIKINHETNFINYKCIEIFNAIAASHPELDFRFKLNNYSRSQEVCKIIVQNNPKYKYFFEEFVHDWDTLHEYISYHPSSIYITEGLGFEIKDVADLLHSLNIEVRCFPNVAQARWEDLPALKKFFIRPEDTAIYDPYIDIYEFFCKPESQSTYYKIYAKDKKWSGQLKEIIKDFNNNIDNRFLSDFAKYRLKCSRRCLKGKRCKICDALDELAAELQKQNLILVESKE